jgi:hypothetical protein
MILQKYQKGSARRVPSSHSSFTVILSKKFRTKGTLATRSLLHCVTICSKIPVVVPLSGYINSVHVGTAGHRWIVRHVFSPCCWTMAGVCHIRTQSKIHDIIRGSINPAMSEPNRSSQYCSRRSNGILSPRIGLLQVVDWAKGLIGGYSNTRQKTQCFGFMGVKFF